MPRSRPSIFALIAPGLLIAATGVGAGDLATAGLSGSRMGEAVLWAVVLGAMLKFILTEGLTRWQLATGTTILEGVAQKLGRWVPILFFLYFLPWCYMTSRALLSGAGVAGHAILPLTDDPEQGKIIWGIVHGIAALLIVRFTSFKRFEQVMGLTIAIMFITVLIAAVLVGPDWPAVLRGLAVPSIPDADGEGFDWTIALIGGVGGTVTILCYAYWIREQGREGIGQLRLCCIDLGIAYIFTALFGIAMVIIATGIQGTGKGANLIVDLADQIEPTTGAFGRWAFLVGAWAAIFSSVMGVWQAVPYLFADLWRVIRAPQGTQTGPVSTRSPVYLCFQVLLATVPMIGLFVNTFEGAQKTYAIMGACFLPMLAVVLLVMNSRKKWIGEANAIRPWTIVGLVLTALFFAWYGYSQIR